MDILSKLLEVNSQLEKANKELLEYNLENFILNPEIQNLTTTIKELNQQKAQLEELLHEEET